MAASAASRTVWVVLTGAFALATVFYAILGFVIHGQPTGAGVPAPLGTLFPVIAVVDLLAAIAWTRFGWRGTRAGEGPMVPPERFMQYTVVSLALAESVAIIGFVQVVAGAPPMTYLPYGLATLLVIALVILPAGLGYWSDRESAGSPGRPIG